MRNLRIELLLNRQEKKDLTTVADKFGMSQSDYIRRKLFYENEDLAADEEQIIIPPTGKRDLVTISVLYKILYTAKEILKNHNSDDDYLIEIEDKALEFAKEERKKYGYKHIKSGNE